MALGSRLKRAARNGLVRAGGMVAALKRSGSGKRAIAMHDVPEPDRFADFLDRILAEYEVVGMDDLDSRALRSRSPHAADPHLR